jgi:hypothetical protein
MAKWFGMFAMILMVELLVVSLGWRRCDEETRPASRGVDK